MSGLFNSPFAFVVELLSARLKKRCSMPWMALFSEKESIDHAEIAVERRAMDRSCEGRMMAMYWC